MTKKKPKKFKHVGLEINSNYFQDEDVKKLEDVNILVTPPIGTDNYWLFRVSVGSGQSVVGFPKFLTIGIGFDKEEDWNCNLPYTSKAEAIYKHIKHNKTKGPRKDKCIAAIKLIQEAAAKYRKGELCQASN